MLPSQYRADQPSRAVVDSFRFCIRDIPDGLYLAAKHPIGTGPISKDQRHQHCCTDKEERQAVVRRSRILDRHRMRDARDVEGIARLLHLGWFRPVHCKSVSAQEVRAVLSARKAVQQGFITLEMSLRGLLRNFGLKVGTISRGRFEQRIRELAAGNPMLEAATEPMLRARSALRCELAGLERHVRQLPQEDPVCRRLMSMPGIGAVVALTYRSAVDDPVRFISSKKVGPWVGLTLSRNIGRARHRGRDHQGR